MGNTHLVSKSLVNSRSEPRNTLQKSGTKTEHHPGVTEKKLISPNIVVSSLLEPNDPDTKIRHSHDLEKPGEFNRSILSVNSKGVQVKKFIRIYKIRELTTVLNFDHINSLTQSLGRGSNVIFCQVALVFTATPTFE